MKSSGKMNDVFFEGSYKDVWRQTIPPGLTQAETDFIIDVAGLNKESKVLDIMCGYGRHAIELAKIGMKVTAVDNLEAYIGEIKEVAKEMDLTIDAVQTSALDMQLSGRYSAAICMGNSFSFFNKDEAVALLKKVSSHLEKGGMLFINSWAIAEIALKFFKEKEWYSVGGYKCLLENKYFPFPGRIETEQTIITKEGVMETINGVDYIHTLDDMECMFKEAGLKTKDLYSTPRKKKYVLGDGRIYIVAEKI